MMHPPVGEAGTHALSPSPTAMLRVVPKIAAGPGAVASVSRIGVIGNPDAGVGSFDGVLLLLDGILGGSRCWR
jgi:hypothetical protein